jgi:hypothetical protein
MHPITGCVGIEARRTYPNIKPMRTRRSDAKSFSRNSFIASSLSVMGLLGSPCGRVASAAHSTAASASTASAAASAAGRGGGGGASSSVSHTSLSLYHSMLGVHQYNMSNRNACCRDTTCSHLSSIEPTRRFSCATFSAHHRSSGGFDCSCICPPSLARSSLALNFHLVVEQSRVTRSRHAYLHERHRVRLRVHTIGPPLAVQPHQWYVTHGTRAPILRGRGWVVGLLEQHPSRILQLLHTAMQNNPVSASHLSPTRVLTLTVGGTRSA